MKSFTAKCHLPKPVNKSTTRENTVAVLLFFHNAVNPSFEFTIHCSPQFTFGTASIMRFGCNA